MLCISSNESSGRPAMETRIKIGAVLSLILMLGTTGKMQDLREDQISVAIQCGLDKVECEKPLISEVHDDFYVIVLPPIGRIYIAADEARRLFLPFTRDDVTKDLI